MGAMAHVVFFEKPGCANNARQKRQLEAAGHTLSVRDLLREPWTAEQLLSFFGRRPVAEWFNRAAPKVKSGAIDPERLDAASAIALMLAEPILIRRPLMEAEGARAIGFDPAHVDAWIGLSAPQVSGADLETCRRSATTPTDRVIAQDDAP
jgi:nitrogenase-associated protein